MNASPTHHSRSSRGFTLIELMVAMLLGLIVIAGVASVFLANLSSYHSNEALADVQSNSRIAFELMARDIRQAGLSGCNSNSGRVANVLNNRATTWWANWNNAVHGYDQDQTDPAISVGTGSGERVAGTDSVMLIGAMGSGLSVKQDSEPAANIKLNETTSNLHTGDIVIICDPDHAAIAQITNYNNSNVTLVHNTGGSTSPGNCSKGLGFPTDCSSTTGNTYTFGPNSKLAKVGAHDWYIGNNPAGGRSLYQLAPDASSGLTANAQEMVRNVTNMQIQYHQRPGNNFVDADAVTQWANVDAVRLVLTIQSTSQRAGTDNKPLVRSFASTTTIRNRVQ